jgi:hypothetical protein
MTLAAVLALYFLSLADPSLGSALALAESAAQDSGSTSASQAQTPSAQSANPAPTPSSGQQQNPPGAAKPSAEHRRHRKKTAVPDCSNSATPLKTPGESNPAASTNTESTDAIPGENPSHQTASSQPSPTTTASPAPKPCPPPKVVVRNGGSNEPTVELKGDTTPEQASQQRYTTEQLTAATEENLKKIAGRQLNPSQQEMVNQIKEFMEQSKKAIADGDVQRGHNLAAKAQLLSDELVKP